MTIDSSWIQALKNDIPCAFTPQKPFAPTAIFIDGQIKLNTALFEHTQTWDEYIIRQFMSSIRKYFEQPKVECIILAFDNYALVPNAKGMTQCKRRKHIPHIDFSARDALPPTVPKGEEWITCLSNRTFKSKLIEFIIFFLVTHLEFGENQSLIIDYQGHPKRYNSKKEFENLDELDPLGEADVKFTRYAPMFHNLQIDSIDGDSVPIALLYLQNTAPQGLITNLSILRMTTKVDSEAPPAAKKQKTGVIQSKKKQGRTYEYLNINLLYHFITDTLIPQCVGRAVVANIQGREINLLIGLIGLSGTDFTRKIPAITGKTLYDYLPLLCMRMGMAYDSNSNHFKIPVILDQVITQIYKTKFRQHTCATHTKLKDILESLQQSKLGLRTKQTLQSFETIECTVKNINWLMQYWTYGTYPSPVQEQYGFVAKSSGAVDYAA